MNGVRFIDSLKPISRQKQEAVRRREALKAEARLRQKLAKSNRRNHRRARPEEALETVETSKRAELRKLSRSAPESEARGGREAAKARQREREQRRNLVLLMNQLEREWLLEDMSEEHVELLEAAAWKMITGDKNGRDWSGILKDLKDRRELRHPPPKYERRRNPPVGW